MKYRIALFILLSFAISATVFAQDTAKKKAYFFFLETCPHCHNVDNYFQSNGIYDKYDITKLDASNPFNGQLLLKFYEANNYPKDQQGGVPAVAFGDKFMVGDQPVIDNFVREIDAADNATELPDPSKIVSSSNSASANQDNNNKQNNQVPASNGNKKNIFPVIIIALIVIGAGALIYVNRKKS